MYNLEIEKYVKNNYVMCVWRYLLTFVQSLEICILVNLLWSSDEDLAICIVCSLKMAKLVETCRKVR